MKETISKRFLILIFLFITSNILVYGQTQIVFDISKGNVRLTDATYSGKNSSGTAISGSHDTNNKYVITGTTDSYDVQVGTTNEFATKDFVIYLNNANIRRNANDKCAFAVFNQGSSTVAVILQDNSNNILYSGRRRAGLEKSGGANANGTLIVTCEAGYEAWKADPTHGHTTTNNHNQSACTETCGHLDARSGNTWNNTSNATYDKAAHTYYAGAGIGSAGYGSGGVNVKNQAAGNNALVNLTIAGGNIEARGAWGYASGTSGGGAAIGTGSASGQEITAGTITGLNITGGNIKAYRVDNSAACIGGGYRSGYVNVNIYGGTIDATLTDALEANTNTNPRNFDKMRAAAIGGGGGGNSSGSTAGATVTIYNGYIKAKGQYGAAIGSGSGGSSGSGQDAEVIIIDGKIEANTDKGNGEGSGAAIGSGGSTGSGHAGLAAITIQGGNITANSEMGADIGGGGTNSNTSSGYGGKSTVTITGGTIEANNGGIGGGRANAGAGGEANINISGNGTTISAKSIGGGRSKKNTGGNVELTVNGGVLNVTDYIGGGIGGTKSEKIGWAKVYITGGTITGRTVMKASTTDGCVFDMSGGTLTSDITDQPGGAVYMIDPNGVATLSGGIIQNCKGITGGAVYMTGGTFTISGDGKMTNNTAAENGAAVYLAGTGKVFVNGGNLTGASGQNFEAIYMSGGEFTMAGGTISNFKGTNSGAVYMEGGTFTMTNGLIDNCNGTESGAIYMSGGKFEISGGTISNCTDAKNGGAVYLGGTGTVNVNGGNITGNTVTADGGAIYMAGGNFTMNNGNIGQCTGAEGGAVYMAGGNFTITNGSISQCQGTADGGAIYMTGGTFTISGNAILQSNNSTNGGAVYLAGSGTLNINGGTIKDNGATANGGAIYLTAGTFNMNAGKVEANKSSGGNGAGIYINNGTVNLQGGEVCGNIASNGKGGGFYVAGGTVTLSNGTISSNKAKEAGGGICLEGENNATPKVSVAVNGCTLTQNEATDGNGGGIFLSNAEMTYNGGILTLNKAIYDSPQETVNFTTGYQADANTVKGIGGGIYISSNSKLTFGDFSKLGVYANKADIAADDLFANGNNTSLLLPNITKMSLQDYAGNADGLGWYEDYIVGDLKYNIGNIAKGDATLISFDNRFRKAQELGVEYMRAYDFIEESRVLKDHYVSLALGFLFSDLTIRVEGLKPGENCIFRVQGTAENGKYTYNVPVNGSTEQYDEQRIIKLPVDKYTVTLLQGWPWAYNQPANVSITKMNSQDEGIYLFSIEHKETSITHDEKNISIKLQ